MNSRLYKYEEKGFFSFEERERKGLYLCQQKTNKNEVVRYQYDNHLGSACLELDVQGDIISYEEYHPFGTTSYCAMNSNIEVSLKRYRYCGKERDEETGLYYYGMRYYAAWLCRFVSVDIMQFEQSDKNPYHYCSNNPINRVDPTGNVDDKWDYDKETNTLTWVSNEGGDETQYVNNTPLPALPAIALSVSTEDFIKGAKELGITVNTEERPVNVNQLSLSEKGANFIKSWEKLRLKPYNDGRNGNDATIGYGHLIGLRPVTEQDKKDYERFTEAMANDLFKTDVARFENAIKSAVKVPLTQYQYDAIISFSFNIGDNAFKGSDFLKALNNGDYNADLMSNWHKPAGVIRRRDGEVKIFKTGTY